MTDPVEPTVVKQIIINMLNDQTINVNWNQCSSIEYFGMLESARMMYVEHLRKTKGL